MVVGDRLESRLEICEGLDTVDLRGLDQGGDASPRPAAIIMAGEERVFAVQSDRADQVLNAVRDDFDAAIVEEGLRGA